MQLARVHGCGRGDVIISMYRDAIMIRDGCTTMQDSDDWTDDWRASGDTVQ